jgi:hypothetical protein
VEEARKGSYVDGMKLVISKRLMLATTVAALAGMGGGIAVVGAHDVKHNQTIDITTGEADPGDPYRLGGTVGSDKEKCDPERIVKLIRERTGADRVRGSDTSDAKGRFKFVFPNGLKSAMYYVTIARRVLRADGAHRHICVSTKTSSFPTGNNP